MRVNVYHRDNTTYVINVRDTDEITEELGLTDAEADTMDDELQTIGRYWVGPYYLSAAKPR